MQVLFLSYPGVAGEVTVAGFSGLISCRSFTMNSRMGPAGEIGYGDSFDPPNVDEGLRGRNYPAGGTGGISRSGGEERKIMGLDSVSISRTVDMATPKFFELAFTDKQDLEGTEEATLIVCRSFERQETSSRKGGGISGKSGAIQWHEPFMLVKMKACHVTSHTLELSTDGLSETFDLGFKEITIEYILFQNGRRLGNVSAQVNIANRADSG